MRITTVIKKPKPHPRATIRRVFFSSITLDEYSGDEYSSSDVISNIIAITASHKLKSDNDKGKYICSLNLARNDTTPL